MQSAELARSLYESYQRREWDAASALLHPAATLDMPATGERLAGREEVVGFQSRYPEPWGDLSVSRVVGGEGDTSSVAVEVEVRAGERSIAIAGFWEVSDGLLWRGVEYWVTVGGELPPPGREHRLLGEPTLAPDAGEVR